MKNATVDEAYGGENKKRKGYAAPHSDACAFSV